MIERLSSVHTNNQDAKSSALVMVGSFAPIHAGHIDAMQSAESAFLKQYNERLIAKVFAPNSDSYVSIKLNDKNGEWNFDKRVSEFDKLDSEFDITAYVDDITGKNPPEKSISDEVIATVSRKIGIAASKVVLVVGSDQLASMKPHIQNNRAVCVLRPGSLDVLLKYKDQEWFERAFYDGRYIITTRTDMIKDISSTAIRLLSSKMQSEVLND